MDLSASESAGVVVAAAGTPNGRYEIVDGRMTVADLLDTVLSVLRGEGTPAEALEAFGEPESGEYRLVLDGTPVSLRTRELADPEPGTLDAVQPPAPRLQVLITAAGALSAGAEELFDRLVRAVGLRGQVYTAAEIDTIVKGMPLVDKYATPEPALRDWALVFRDHYVENSVGFLLGMERAGLDPRWIFALSKGDRTAHRERVHAWFLHRGYRSDILDNSVINGSADTAARAYALAVNEQVDEFIRDAHAAGRKVLVIDDGGLLAQGYGADVLEEHIDGALELTVSGLKRIANAPGELTVPVMNMARSRLKTMLGYHEIADSCVRRLRAILPGEKFLGRHVLLLGFGTLGARVAHYLRSQGVRVSVVDTDMLALITAAEHGYETYTSAAEALRAHSPFLIIGNTGELALTPENLPLLPDGVYLAGFATKDFSLLSEGEGTRFEHTPVPHVGVRYHLPTGTTATLLGDGRSLNLFEYEGIANRGYDAYRAGTLITAKLLCRKAGELPPGIHLEPVDEEIEAAGLFAAYYHEYLASGGRRPEGGPRLEGERQPDGERRSQNSHPPQDSCQLEHADQARNGSLPDAR